MAQPQASAQGAGKDTGQVKAAVENETGATPGDLQMTSTEMRDLTQKVADLVLDRYEGLPAEEVFERAARQILPIAARIDHPRFFGFIPSSPTWPGMLADFMVAGFHVNQCTWLTSSGPSQLELVVIDWIRRWLGYPEGAGGLFTSGGSAASVDAFVAAREAAGNPERATVYMSDQSHSAFSRAAVVVGVRRECIRIVPSLSTSSRYGSAGPGRSC